MEGSENLREGKSLLLGLRWRTSRGVIGEVLSAREREREKKGRASSKV